MSFALVILEKNTNIVMAVCNSLPIANRLAVAVGVIFNDEGKILVASRAYPQQEGECWEFPGGKIEPGESVACALKRELFEEVGIVVTTHQPWLIIEHDYADKAVCLQVHQVTSFSGEPQNCLGQKLQWLAPKELLGLKVPKANEGIVKELQSVVIARSSSDEAIYINS